MESWQQGGHRNWQQRRRHARLDVHRLGRKILHQETSGVREVRSFLSIAHILLIENAIQRKWPELGCFPVGIIVNQHDVAIQSVGLVVIDQLIGIIGRHLT